MSGSGRKPFEWRLCASLVLIGVSRQFDFFSCSSSLNPVDGIIVNWALVRSPSHRRKRIRPSPAVRHHRPFTLRSASRSSLAELRCIDSLLVLRQNDPAIDPNGRGLCISKYRLYLVGSPEEGRAQLEDLEGVYTFQTPVGCHSRVEKKIEIDGRLKQMHWESTGLLYHSANIPIPFQSTISCCRQFDLFFHMVHKLLANCIRSLKLERQRHFMPMGEGAFKKDIKIRE